jgi:small subunit ribosomal protein S7
MPSTASLQKEESSVLLNRIGTRDEASEDDSGRLSVIISTPFVVFTRNEDDTISQLMRRHEMPRRKRAVRRPDVPDARFKSRNVARFIGKLMLDGKRSLAERIIYDAFEAIEARQKRAPLDVFEQALKNVTPTLEVKPRRVGGSTYQVPVDIRRERGNTLAMRWLIRSARIRTGKSMSEKLANELMDAAAGQGATIKKREETHKMAESNKAFAHYRW